jgi:hypothetical protein
MTMNIKTYGLYEAAQALNTQDLFFAMFNDDYGTFIWSSDTVAKPTLEQLEAKRDELNAAAPLAALREERDRLLKETDWWAVTDRTMTSEQTAYRQELRDLPANTADPTNPTWPTKPS